MIYLDHYTTAASFLAETETYLCQRELENNMILGFSKAFAAEEVLQESVLWTNVCENGQIQATAMLQGTKLMIATNENQAEAINTLAHFYAKNQLDVVTVIAEKACSELFENHYPETPTERIGLLLHQLITVNPLHIAAGQWEYADMAEIDLLADWLIAFQTDIHDAHTSTKEEAVLYMKKKVAEKAICKWLVAGEMVSIAGIVRKTPHIAMVGLVYTSPNMRGKGYATSIVQALSEKMLQQGFVYCGLFTEMENAVSNYIYQKIGYVAGAEFRELVYGSRRF